MAGCLSFAPDAAIQGILGRMITGAAGGVRDTEGRRCSRKSLLKGFDARWFADIFLAPRCTAAEELAPDDGGPLSP
jgi:hypothetical protein